VNPIVVYENCDIDKSRILQENRKKSAVYRWVNKVNNKTYVGSSIDLSTRLYKYFSLRHLVKAKTPIYNALLKYGYSNFRLEILEYCNIKDTISREQYYIDNLKPDYNLAKTAGSTLGFKFTEETLELLKKRSIYASSHSGEIKKKLSEAATGRVLTEDEKEKIANWHRGKIVSDETKSKISKARILKSGVGITVKDITNNEEICFESLTSAAKFLDVSRTAVSKALKSNNFIKKRYIISAKKNNQN
jgi:group I intron endonuclease